MKCFCLDLDGTLYRGNMPVKYAPEFLSRLKSQNIGHIALTNCPLRSAEGVSMRLLEMGIELPARNVLTAGMTAARVLKESSIKSVYVVGSDALRQECKARGLAISENADAVLIGYDEAIAYEHIKRACILVQLGAGLYCTNCDNTIPEGEFFIPHTGAIAKAIEHATGKNCTYIGKPETYMLKDAMRMMDCEAKDICVVGDRLDTDIAFAENCGVKSCLVLTGTTTMQMVLGSAVKPDFVFDNLKDLWERLL